MSFRTAPASGWWACCGGRLASVVRGNCAYPGWCRLHPVLNSNPSVCWEQLLLCVCSIAQTAMQLPCPPAVAEALDLRHPGRPPTTPAGRAFLRLLNESDTGALCLLALMHILLLLSCALGCFCCYPASASLVSHAREGGPRCQHLAMQASRLFTPQSCRQQPHPLDDCQAH